MILRAQIKIFGRVTALLLAAAASAALAQGAAKCQVLDPELQDSYVGGCKDGKAEGLGTATGIAAYTGEFHEGKKHGRGVKTWARGDRYEGDFFDDEKSGEGRYTWGDRSLFAGDRYVGHFANDKRDGFGLYVWGSGDSYAGPWKADAVAGPGTPMMIARYRATNAALEVMATVGLKLCRESVLGIGVRERVEGESQGVNKELRQVSVKITLLGQTPLLVAGTPVKLGEIVQDDPVNWIPCN
jgi:hypothetical protein